MKALVIDDVEDLRALLLTILRDWGIECIEAEDGQQALETLASRGPFDFCTVDIHMPVLDGFSFVSAVRKNRAHDGMKLLIVTTETDKPSVDKALKIGADEYLMKPFTKDMIESKLRLMGMLP